MPANIKVYFNTYEVYNSTGGFTYEGELYSTGSAALREMNRVFHLVRHHESVNLYDPSPIMDGELEKIETTTGEFDGARVIVTRYAVEVPVMWYFKYLRTKQTNPGV
jgi:hypothetical protein